MFLYGYPQRYDDSNPDPYAQISTVRGGQPYLDDAILRERAQVLAEQRARKAKWLPDEVDNSYDESNYTELGPQERAYIDALRKKQVVEHLWRQRGAQALEEAARQREQQEKWKQELEKKQREDEEARHKFLEKRRQEMRIRREEAARAIVHERLLRAQQQQRQQERNWPKSRGPGLQSRPENSEPINFRRTPSPQSTTRPLHPPSKTHAVPESKSQSSSKAIYDEKHDSAASRIQQQYRIHKSHRILNDLASQFQTLKQNFVYPRVIDFQKPGSDGHITVHANPDDEANDEPSMEVDGEDGELAYTPVNYHLHTYADAMEKLVMKLDGVDSVGNKGVREKRRSIVREISKESTNLEGYCKRIWLDYVEKQNEEARKLEVEKLEKRQAEIELESQAMDIDEEPVQVEHHEAKEDVDEWIEVAESASAPEANGVPQGEPLVKHISQFTPSIELEVDPIQTSIPLVSN